MPKLAVVIFVLFAAACGQQQDLGGGVPATPEPTPTPTPTPPAPNPTPQSCILKVCSSNGGPSCGRTVDDGCGGTMTCQCPPHPTPDACANRKADPDESDVDCGGKSTCARCSTGQSCKLDGDCTSNRCVDDLCHVSTWATAQPMPTARGQFGLVAASDGLVYAAGGMGTQSAVNAMEAYDPANDEWTALAAMPTNRYGVCAVEAADGRIYVVGGQYDNSGAPFTDGLSVKVESYSPATNTWRNEPSLQEGRYNPACVSVAGKIWVLGGMTVNPIMTLATIETFAPGDSAWVTRASTMTTARYDHSAVIGPDGLVYVFGGGDLSSNAAMSQTAERMNPATATFTTLPQMPGPRGAAAVASGSSAIFVFGGTQARQSSQAFNPATKQWMTLPDLPSSRRAARAMTVQNTVFVVGGYESSGFSEGPSRLVEVFTY